MVAISLLYSSHAFAVDVGDRVYGVFGSHDSNLRIESGYVTTAGNSSSKVEWDNCYNCNKWINNSNLWYDRSSAQVYVNKKDSEHTSIGEAAGAVAGAAILCGLFNCLD